MAGHRQSDEHWNCFKSQRWMEKCLRDGPVKTIWAFPRSRTNGFGDGILVKKLKKIKQDKQKTNKTTKEQRVSKDSAAQFDYRPPDLNVTMNELLKTNFCSVCTADWVAPPPFPPPPQLPQKRGTALFKKKSNSDNNYNTQELIIPGFYTNLTQALGESANDNIPNFSGSP